MSKPTRPLFHHLITSVWLCLCRSRLCGTFSHLTTPHDPWVTFNSCDAEIALYVTTAYEVNPCHYADKCSILNVKLNKKSLKFLAEFSVVVFRVHSCLAIGSFSVAGIHVPIKSNLATINYTKHNITHHVYD